MTESFRIQILQWYESGQPDHAIQRLQNYYNENPQDLHALYLLGILCFKSDRFHDASLAMNQLIDTGGGNPTACSVLIHSLRMTGSRECIGVGLKSVGLYPESAECRHELGLSYVAYGQIENAIENFRSACELSPHSCHFSLNLALSLMKVKEYHEALHYLLPITDTDLVNGDIWYYIGLCQGYEKSFPKAYEALNLARSCGYPSLSIDATILKLKFQEAGATETLLASIRDGYLKGIRDEEFLDLFGEVLYQLRKYDELIKLSDELIIEKKVTARMQNLTGLSYMDTERYGEAEVLFRNTLDTFPGDPSSLVNLGLLQQRKGDHTGAIASMESALRICPDDCDALYNLATLQLASNSQRAEELLRRVIELNPEYGKAYNHLGIISLKRDNYDGAFHYFEMAERYLGEIPEVLNNRGLLLYQCRMFYESEQLLKKACSMDSGNPEIHRNLAFALLAQRKFQEGWKEYSWRLKSKSREKEVCPHPDRSQIKKGMKLLVLPEQGLGDTIQFVRYLRELQEIGAHVRFKCPAELEKLFRLSEWAETLISDDELAAVVGGFDMSVSLMSLPGLFIHKSDNIIGPKPYLKADISSTQRFRTQFSPSVFHCGIAWKGNRSHKNDHRRSMNLRSFNPLFQIEGVGFHSLQKEVDSSSSEIFKSFNNMVSHQHELHDVADTAALIMNLDILITVDTMVAHLAGALGKKVLLLLPFAPDWRWECINQTSGWYCEMEVFRQKNPGDWDTPISEAGDRLRELVNQRRKASE